jgi:hypothetical protein
MRLRDGETVSSLAPVIDDADEPTSDADDSTEPRTVVENGTMIEEGGEVFEPVEDEQSEEDVFDDDEPSTE